MYDKGRSKELLALESKTKEQVEELIKLNEGLMGIQLKKFGLIGNHDAISLAYEALFTAIMTYRPTGSEFSTYASVCIYNKLGCYIRSLNTQIRQNTISYDSYATDDSTFIDLLPSNDTADGEVLTEDAVGTLMVLCGQCINAAQNPKHKKMLRIWMESDFTMTQAEIAEQLGCSQTYVSRVINKFRKLLKSKLEVEK